MNDLGLESSIQVSEDAVQRGSPPTPHIQRKAPPPRLDERALQEHGPGTPDMAASSARKPHKSHRRHKQGHHPIYEDEEDSSIYQPTHWWFASTAFPLFAGTFGPIANLFSVCALAQTWRVWVLDGRRVPDPPWLLACNACSLVFALAANVVLLFNFARRIRYSVAQPITISFWYLSCILLVVPIGLTHDSAIYSYPTSVMARSQAYYYALISGVLYFTISTLLLLSTLGAIVFHAYPASCSTLTPAQRTLMLQTVSFSLYLALGAGVFSSIENWGFADGVYWADYTLLTVGLGTDFPLTTTLGRMLLIPYAAFGITLIGLVVSSVRGLVLERAKAKVARRHLGKERERWKENIKERKQLAEIAASTMDSSFPRTPLQERREKLRHRQLMKLPQQLSKRVSKPLKPEDQRGAWHRAEFELMRFIEVNAESAERYTALGISFIVILVVWFTGSVVFWACEHRTQGWTYPESVYFTYTTLLTIGYGDFYPNSPAGKPFFVVWSLISVPAMTVLISNMGDTVVKLLQDATLWASRRTILPERLEQKHQERKGRPKTRDDTRRHAIIDKAPESAASTAVGDPPDKPVSTASATAPKHPGSKRPRKPRHNTDDAAENEPSNVDILEHDVEKLGGAVEHFEEEEGRSGSLAAQLAREISRLAKDLRAKPPKKYPWEEWERWLKMLGEREDELEGMKNPPHEGGKREEGLSPVPIISPLSTTRPPTPTTAKSHAPTLVAASADGATALSPTDPKIQSKSDVGRPGLDAEHAKDWHWTWLGDHGPLFSRLTETEWLIEKLCFRLEEVLEDEIREARGEAKLRS